ncbi:MAG: carboxypeptidase-like regulatory domain-containing protein [Tenuifilaceae bacterium]|jgi:hypothetical protein|nr:carboxypeptidase-like regulatory domain-containing protein [Tenuifilaceae bacterium]
MKKLSTLLIIAMMATMNAMAIKNENEKLAEKSAEATPALMNSISGKVVDKTTGESLVGVKVVLEGTQHETFTDFDGNFNFRNLSLGEAKLSASLISYEKTSLTIDNPTGSIKVSLKSAY